MALQISIVPRKAPMVVFGSAMAGLPVGHQKETHQKKKDTWCVGLKWLPFSGNTQQPTNSWRKL
jgi:hypothetical protein